MIIKYFSLLRYNFKISLLCTLLIAIFIDSVFSILSVLAIIPLVDIIQDQDPENYNLITRIIVQILEKFNLSLTIKTAAIIFLTCNFLKPLSNYLVQNQIMLLKYNFLHSILKNLLNLVFISEWRKVEKISTGVIMNVFTKEIHNLGDGLNLMVIRTTTLIQLLSYICVPLYIDFYLTITVLSGFLFTAVPFIGLTFLGRKYGKLNLETINNLIGFVSEMTRNLKMFVATNTGSFASQQFDFYFSKHLEATVRSQLFDKAIAVFFRPLALSVIITILIYQSAYGTNITNMITIIWSLISIVPILNSLIQSRLSLSILEPSFIQIQNVIADLSESKIHSYQTEKIYGNYEIEFSNISYSVNETQIIKRLSFTIPVSKIICIIGPSGSGKSTIIDLILGLKTPTEGRISYNGIDASNVDFSFYRKSLGYVGQDPVKLNGSIRNNIFWRNENLDERDLREMIVLSNCEFIWNLPMQLDELIGENNVQLSGGQWQRLSILRAIISKPKLLILDEATSALDMISELKVIKGFKSLSWCPTIVVVSHRKGPIECANEILDLGKNYENLEAN